MESENIAGQVDEAVEKAQQLDRIRQAIQAETGNAGGTLLVAHDLNGAVEINDLS